MPHLHTKNTGLQIWRQMWHLLSANVAFTILAPDLLLIYCTFATYLPRANLSKSIFPSSDIQYSKDSATVAARYCDFFMDSNPRYFKVKVVNL